MEFGGIEGFTFKLLPGGLQWALYGLVWALGAKVWEGTMAHEGPRAGRDVGVSAFGILGWEP